MSKSFKDSVLDKKYIKDSYIEIKNKMDELENTRNQIGEFISDMQVNKHVIAGNTYKDSVAEDDIRLDTDKIPTLKKMIDDDLDNVERLLYKVRNLSKECNGTSDSEIKEISESLYEDEIKLSGMKDERENASKYVDSLKNLDVRENTANHKINSLNVDADKSSSPATESGGSGGNSGSGGSGGGGKKTTKAPTKSSNTIQGAQGHVAPEYIRKEEIQSSGDRQFNMVLANANNVASVLDGIIINGKQVGDRIYNMGNKTYSIDGIYDLSPQRLSAAIDAVEQ